MSAERMKPQDLVVALKLAAHPGEPWTYAGLSSSLHMSAAEVHASVKRLIACRLYSPTGERVSPKNLLEVLLHGVWYFFPAEEGPLVRGIPTAWSAAPLASRITRTPDGEVVWPSPDGDSQGHGIEPLYASAPLAALEDDALYELLALADALRAGRPRERKLAGQELTRRLAL